MALGATNGMAPFHQSSGSPSGDATGEWDLSGSLHKPVTHLSAHPWCKFKTSVDVQVMRLDTWARGENIHHIDLIWADVQGAEGDLVRGGTETLAQTKYFYTEFNDHEMYEGQPTLALLRVMLPHFELMRQYENDVLFRNMRMQ